MRRRWFHTWPAIIVGLVLCVVPGLLLLWTRPGTGARAKSAVTLGAVVVLVAAVRAPSPQPGAPSAQASPSVTSSASASSTQTTPSTTGSAEPTPTPTPSTASATPTPTPAPSLTPSASSAPGTGTAYAAAAALVVKGRAPRTGYVRSEFGAAWVDVDRNGCDTRNDLLAADLTHLVMSGSCRVMAGTLADPYTGRSIRFVRGGVSEVDLDHLVPLSDAWQKGAQSWPYAKRVAFANDPLNLQPTDAATNRSKGDGDAATWLPPMKSYRCTYVARQVAVKAKYHVWVTAAEQAAMLRVLSGCAAVALPAPGPQPTIASNTGPRPATATPTPRATTSGGGGGTDPNMRTCKAAKAAGYGPYVRGVDPEYYFYVDRDKDGIVCE